MTRRDRGRKAAPAPLPLDSLEAELRAARPAASLTAAAAAAITAYVAANPGAVAKTVILEGRGRLSYRSAEDLLRTLLDSGELRSDRPGVPFHGHHRLYVAE